MRQSLVFVSALAVTLGLGAPSRTRAEDEAPYAQLLLQDAPPNGYSSLRFSPDGTTLVAAYDSDRRADLWSLRTGVRVGDTRRKLPWGASLAAEEPPVECADAEDPLTCHAAGGAVAQVDADGELVVTVHGATRLRCATGMVFGVAVSPDGARVAVAADERLWVMPVPGRPQVGGTCLDRATTSRPSARGGTLLRFSLDGEHLFSAAAAFSAQYSSQPVLRRYFAPLQRLLAADLRIGTDLVLARDPAGTRLAVSPTGDRLLVFGPGATVDGWDLRAAARAPLDPRLASVRSLPIAAVPGQWVAAAIDEKLGFAETVGGVASRYTDARVALPPPGEGWTADAVGDRLVVAGRCATSPDVNGICSSGGPPSSLLLASRGSGATWRWTMPAGRKCELHDVALVPDGALAVEWCADPDDGSRPRARIVRWRAGADDVEAVPDDALPDDLPTSEVVAIATAPDGGLAIATRERVCLSSGGEEDAGTCPGITPHNRGAIRDIALTADSASLLVLLDTGVIELHDTELAFRAASFHPVGTSDYAIVLPGGAYTATPAALDLLAFRVEGSATVEPAAALDPWLHRPADVLEALGFAEEAAIARARTATAAWRARVGGDVPLDDASRPALVVRGATFDIPRRRLLLEEVDAASTVASGLEIRVNGVPVPAPTIHARGGGKASTVEIPLRTGPNRVRVVARGAGGQPSVPQRIDVLLPPGPRPARLWFVGIAVENYEALSKLTYPHADVRRLWSALSSAMPLPAGNPRPSFVLEERVTRAALRRIAQKLARTAPDDLVVVAVSGHGVADANAGWVFAPADFHGKGTGIPYAAFEQLFATIPAQRRLLVIDACNAGPGAATGADEGEKVRLPAGVTLRAVEEAEEAPPPDRSPFLQHDRGLGVQVMAASTVDQWAWERASRQGGFFTAALAEGLGSMDADLDGDATVSVQEWMDYAQREVEAWTMGLQRPLFRSQSREADFPLSSGVPPAARRSWCRGALAGGEPCEDRFYVYGVDADRRELLVGPTGAPPARVTRVSFTGARRGSRPTPPFALPNLQPDAEGRIWRTDSHEALPGRYDQVAATSADGRWLLAETAAGRLVQLHLEGGRAHARRVLDLEDARGLHAPSIGLDGSVVGTVEGELLLWGPWKG